MSVTIVKARYLRRTQPAEYQPVECELEATVVAPEGGDAMNEAVEALNELRHLVHQSVGAPVAQPVGLIYPADLIDERQRAKDTAVLAAEGAEFAAEDEAAAEEARVAGEAADKELARRIDAGEAKIELPAADPWDDKEPVSPDERAPVLDVADPWDEPGLQSNPVPAAETKAPAVTLDDCRAAAARMAEKHSPAAVKAIIASYNVAQLADLPKKQWASFIAKTAA